MKNNAVTKAMNAIAKVNIWIVSAMGIAAAVWLIVGWDAMPLAQRINVAMIIALSLHEWEENHIPGGFMDLMIDRIWGLPELRPIVPLTRVVVTVGMIVCIVLPAFFPNVGWFCIMPLLLGVFEGFIHVAGIFLTKIGKPYTPGMATALFCLAPVGGYGIWYWEAMGSTTSLDWVFAVVEFFVFFGFLYGGILYLIDMPFPQFIKQVRSNVVKLHRK